MMRRWQMCRTAATALLVAGLVLPSPVAWAQLATVDPALAASVDALVANDPELTGDPELAELCRTVAEATVLDPRERAAVTREAAELVRQGTDLSEVIPDEVRQAAREQFVQMQGDLQEKLETLRATDPEAARELELMMREGEAQMRAFENGGEYIPSTEMVAHAQETFGEWKDVMLEQGVPADLVARAEAEFAQWSGGGMSFSDMVQAGPGDEMQGPPTAEHLQQMASEGQISQEQFGQMMADLEAWTNGDDATRAALMEQYGGMHDGFGPQGGWEGFGPAGEGWEQYGGTETLADFQHDFFGSVMELSYAYDPAEREAILRDIQITVSDIAQQQADSRYAATLNAAEANLSLAERDAVLGGTPVHDEFFADVDPNVAGSEHLHTDYVRGTEGTPHVDANVQIHDHGSDAIIGTLTHITDIGN